jgi:arylsulfatase A-like enzyme
VRTRQALGLVLGAIGSFALGALARAGWDSMQQQDARVATAVEAVAADAAREPGGAAVRAAVAPKTAPAAVRPAAARTEHAIWKLVDNRHAAHRYVDDELVIDASGIGLARYARFGVPAVRWHYGHTVGGERASIADRLAPLELPLGGDQARAATHLTLRVHAKAGQAIGLRVGGKSVTGARIKLAGGWQTVAIPVPAGRLGVGENQVALETLTASGPIAVAWMRVGQERAGAGEDDPRQAATFDPKADAIELAKDASLVWYVTVPDGGHLVASVTEGCTVEVRARNSDGAFAGGALRASQARVDLTAMAGRVVALGLTARDCPRTTITAPRIAVHGPAPELRPAAPPPKYVVLWVMDTLRALSVPLFTPGARAQTPNLDELAKTSAVFRQFYVQGNESQTSHSSLWTGLYPAVHNVRLAGVGGYDRLLPKFDVLAKRLADAGFTAVGTTANGFVNEWGGYARGFREYRNLMREPGANNIVYGERVLKTALDQLDRNRSDRAYVFLGTVDSHFPWIARRPWIDIYSPGPYNGPFQEMTSAVDLGIAPGSMGCATVPPKRDIERLHAIYDSTISYQDQKLGELIAQLKSWGIWDQTMLILTADHGEELFEHGGCGHGSSMRDLLIHVPLLIHDPARFPGGTIVDEGAEAVDVMPTVLDAVGAPVNPAAQGRSLIPLAQGFGRGWAQPSYSSMFEYAHAMRIGRWKIRVPPSGTPLIHDLVADPLERADLAGARAVERRMLTDNIGMFLALRKVWGKREWGVTTNITAEGAAVLDGASTP